MAAFVKLFKKKHNKENDEPFLKFNDEADSAARSNSSIYTGDYPTRSCIADSNDFRWKSPYDVVTAPQTRKPTRSCPGAPIHTKSSSGSGATSRSRHLSPDYGRRLHVNKHATIFEVSGSYENYPNEAYDAYDDQNGKLPTADRTKISSKRVQNSDAYVVGSMRERSTFQRNQHKRQSLNLRGGYCGSDSGQGSYRRIRQRQHNVASTSEYGSGDPSPTNPASGAIAAASERMNNYFEPQSFNNTDYEDSDSEDESPLTIVDICEQQLRKLTIERNKYKEKARNNKVKYIEMCAKLEDTMAELACEKREVESLKANLNRTKAEMENFRSFINQQFRKVGGHYQQLQQQQLQQQQQQQQWLQEQQELLQQPSNFSTTLRQHNSNLHGLRDLTSQQMSVNENGTLNPNDRWQNMSNTDKAHALGAGEALCSRTEIFGSVNPAFTADLPTSSAQTMNMGNMQLPVIQDNDDEVKPFRRPEIENDKDSLSLSHIEEARDASSIKIPFFQCSPNQSFSPPFFKRAQNGDNATLADDEEDASVTVKNDNSANYKLNDQEYELTEAIYEETADDQSSDDSLDINDPEKNLNFRKALRTPMQRNFTTSWRSFSETDLDNLCARTMDDNNNSFVINLDDAIELNDGNVEGIKERLKCVDFDCANDGTEKIKSSNISKSRYCRYSPKRNADHSSSYSSDDDAIRIFARQLRKRGDLVHFRPGRKNLVNMEHKIFQCFGSGEREAIAQFDYLKDIPTDISDLVSSPNSKS